MSLGKAKMLSQGASGAIVGTDNFNTVIWTNGVGQHQSPIAVGFQPDFVWIKMRNAGTAHVLTDSVRGARYTVFTTDTDHEYEITQGLTAFQSNGFALGNDSRFNQDQRDAVAWCWRAPTSESISASGSRIASTVKKNVDAGFSIVKGSFATNGASSGTVGHGLTSPKLIIYKATNIVLPWFIFGEHGGSVTGNDNVFRFDSNAASNDSSFDITSTTFSVGSTNTAHEFIAYCFADVAGYQKIGNYTGNGNNTGTVVDTGFTPRFLIIKAFTGDNGGGNWLIYDNVRSTSNPRNKRLYADLNIAEQSISNYDVDFLTGATKGFQPKVGASYYGINTLNVKYLYLAIA